MALSPIVLCALEQRPMTRHPVRKLAVRAGAFTHDHIGVNDTTDVCMDTFGGYERYHACAPPSPPLRCMHLLNFAFSTDLFR